MIAAACALLALGVAAFLISPLLDGQRRKLGRSLDAEDLDKRKDFLYVAIRELNIDYNMGKMSQEDYQKLQAEYMQEASSLLDRIEQTANGKQQVVAQIEAQVLEIRRQRAGARHASSTQPVISPPVALVEEIACARCGTANEEHAKFCIECGAGLKQTACASCGAANRPEARFCGQCGQKMA